MAQNLMEAYKKRLTIAESYFAKNHNGQKPDQNRMLVTAQVLKNANQFLGEAFDNSVGTQRADIGNFKRFVMNIDTITLPNLIAHDIVAVVPMSSMTGYITYMKFVSGSNKGDVEIGEDFNSPFKLGTALQKNFTGQAVISESKSLSAAGKEISVDADWFPVVGVEFVRVTHADGTVNRYEGNDLLTSGEVPAGKVKVQLPTYTARGTASPSLFPDGSKNEENHEFGTAKTITLTFGADLATTDKVAVGYLYDNVRIPQEDLPTLDMRMEGIALMAKPRRIAIYFSQMAAFQAKTEYGVDMGAQLAEQAASVLAYDIDTEIIKLLANEAFKTGATLIGWDRTIPVGVSKLEHYAGFEEAIYQAAQIIYSRTQKFTANYMIISSDILPIISLCKSFVAAPVTNISGPYMAGTFGGMKVFVSPAMGDGRAVFGYKGNGLEAAPAVLGTFMPIVPTQLIQGPDGGSAQGFSSLVDIKLLNADLVVGMQISGDPNTYYAQTSEKFPFYNQVVTPGVGG